MRIFEKFKTFFTKHTDWESDLDDVRFVHEGEIKDSDALSNEQLPDWIKELEEQKQKRKEEIENSGVSTVEKFEPVFEGIPPTIPENDIVQQLIYIEEDKDIVLKKLRTFSPKELQRFVKLYNWDDGFDIPTEILNFPNCELAIALEMGQLGAVTEWFYEKEKPCKKWQEPWRDFSKLLLERLNSNYFHAGDTKIKDFEVREFSNIDSLEFLGISNYESS